MFLFPTLNINNSADIPARRVRTNISDGVRGKIPEILCTAQVLRSLSLAVDQEVRQGSSQRSSQTAKTGRITGTRFLNSTVEHEIT